MPDAVELVKTIKRAALDAMESSKPATVVFGKVTSVSPLKINVEQKMILGEAQLILSRNVTDFKTSMTIGNTQTYYYTGVPPNTSQMDVGHKHAIGKAEVTVHNSLAVGDEVILIRQQGGQKFIVWDRIG